MSPITLAKQALTSATLPLRAGGIAALTVSPLVLVSPFLGRRSNSQARFCCAPGWLVLPVPWRWLINQIGESGPLSLQTVVRGDSLRRMGGVLSERPELRTKMLHRSIRASLLLVAAILYTSISAQNLQLLDSLMSEVVAGLRLTLLPATCGDSAAVLQRLTATHVTEIFWGRYRGRERVRTMSISTLPPWT